MDDNDGQMIFGDLGGLKLPVICLTGEEKPRKTSPRKLVPTGDRTRARCVASAHASSCSTAVDWCVPNNWLRGPHRGCSTEQFDVENLGSVKPVIQNTPGIFLRMLQNLVRRCYACVEVGGRQFEQLF